MKKRLTRNQVIDLAIINFAIPAMGERTLIYVIYLINTFILGNIGKVVLSGMSLANGVIEIINTFYLGLTLVTMIEVTKFTSLKNDKKVSDSLSSSVILCSLTGVLFAGLIFLNTGSIITLLYKNAEDKVLYMATRYLKIAAFAFPFIGADFALSAALRGSGDSKTPFNVSLISNIAYVFLAIFVSHPKIYQFAEIYISSIFVFSKILCCVIKLVVIKYKSDMYFGRAKLHTIVHIFKSSLLSIGEQTSIQLGFLGVQIITTVLGTSVIAGYQIANTIMSIIYTITYGVEIAMVSLLGRSLAKKNRPMAVKVMKRGYLISIVCPVVVGILVIIFATPATRIFSKEPDVIKEGSYILKILCGVIFFTSVFQFWQGVFKGLKKLSIVFLLNFIGPWLVRVPVGYIFAVKLNMGINGLLLGLFADYFVRSLGYVIYAHIKRILDPKSDLKIE